MFWELSSITDNLVSKCLFLVYILFFLLDLRKQNNSIVPIHEIELNWNWIEAILAWSFPHFKHDLQVT